jgi:hypothetical protein
MLVITGSEDNSHNSTWELQRNVPDCEVVSVGGAGHACNMEQPWEWDAIFLEFLERRGLFEGVGADRLHGCAHHPWREGAYPSVGSLGTTVQRHRRRS